MTPRPYPLPFCRYYGYSPQGLPTGGNQCALVVNCHAPCYLEIAGKAPDEMKCERVLIATLERIERERREVQ
jgi:hypothetical protein